MYCPTYHSAGVAVGAKQGQAIAMCSYFPSPAESADPSSSFVGCIKSQWGQPA